MSIHAECDNNQFYVSISFSGVHEEERQEKVTGSLRSGCDSDGRSHDPRLRTSTFLFNAWMPLFTLSSSVPEVKESGTKL